MPLKDAIYGLAVGDALGVPYEFMHRGSFTVSPDMIGGGVHGQKPGTFSDDTSMTIATADSIRRKGRVDVKDIRRRFENWLYEGEYAVNGNVFDCGNTVSTAITEKRGCAGEFSNGNGSLMRIIPLAYVNATNDDIRAVSAITHAHETAMNACVEYVAIARELESGRNPIDVIKDYQPEVISMERREVSSSGYVLDSLTASLWCLTHTDTYEDAIIQAVSLGDDSDTTAAITGALAGIVYGYDAIPARWIRKLRGKRIIDKSIEWGNNGNAQNKGQSPK